MQKLLEINKLKEMVATFLGLTPSEINDSTVIDRRAVKGSIMVHRMYAVLAREGFDVPGGGTFTSFGELVRALRDDEKYAQDNPVTDKPLTDVRTNLQQAPALSILKLNHLAVGIDIEMVTNMPVAVDFREDAFYRQNFSEREIAQCILQKEPRQSFAGKFCAKEAIIKADNRWQEIPFNKIEILNAADGSPYCNGFSLSISHTSDYAIAIALKGCVG